MLSAVLSSVLAAALATACLLTSCPAFSQPPATDSSHQVIDTGELRIKAQTLLDQGKPDEALAIVAAEESALANDPEYDYLLGTTALAAGKPAVAVNALERAVLVQPGFAGAWLDLAIAHFRLGDIEVADGILQHIDTQFDPPPHLRTEIAEVRRKIARARLTSGWQAEFGAFTGHTNNANFGLSVSSLQLNLSGTPVSLLLDPSYSPRSDSFNEFRATATGRFDHAESAQSEIYASARYRGYTTESTHDQRNAIISAMWRRPLDWIAIEGASVVAGGSARSLSYPGQTVTITQASGGLRLPVGSCQVTGRADLEYRFFSGLGAYDAGIPWLGVSAECAKGDIQYGGQQRIGLDYSINNRPGGNTLRTETVGFGRWHARPNLQLGAMMFFAYAKDADPYSPLLARGDQRWVNRFGQKLEAIWAPGTNPRSPWAVVIEYENIADRSNIGLSNMKINQLQVGLVYRYF